MASTGVLTPDPVRASSLSDIRQAVRRELGVLARRPDLTWPQLHNRLQWAGQPLIHRLEAERQRRGGPDRRPWFHRYTSLGESDALVRTLTGHAESVKACTFSPDGTFVVSASCDNTLKIWDVATGAETQTLIGHTDWVTGCAISPDGALICSSSSDGTVRLWDATSGVQVHSLAGPGLRACAFGPDGAWVAATHGTTAGSGVKIWEVATTNEIQSVAGHRGAVWGCAVDPTGAFVVTASHDNSLKVWDVAAGRRRATLAGHEGFVTGCSVTPDGRWILSASHDNSLKVWEAETGLERATLIGHTEPVSSCAVSPDGTYAISASWDQTVRVWDLTTYTERAVLSGHTDATEACAVAPDGTLVVSAGADNVLMIWDPTLAVSPAGATAGPEKIPFEEVVPGSGTPVPDPDPHRVSACRFSADGSWIVTARHDHTLGVVDAATGGESRTLIGHTRAVTGCAVDPSFRWIASASLDGTVRIWDGTADTQILSIDLHRVVWGCAGSPDGTWVAVAVGGDSLQLFDVAEGVQIRSVRAPDVRASGAVSPDGRWIAAGCEDGTVGMWDAATGEEIDRYRAHDGYVKGCAIGPDGSFIVSAGADHTLQVWDTRTGTSAHTLTGHDAQVNDCSVSPDGRWLVSVSDDRTVRLWEVAGGVERAALAIPGQPTAVAVHPSEPVIAVGDQGGRVHLASVVNVECGPLPVTATASGGTLSARCPSCGEAFPVPEGELGVALTCPAGECGVDLRLNRSAVRPLGKLVGDGNNRRSPRLRRRRRWFRQG